MRTLLTTILALATLGLAALETPLILKAQNPNSDHIVVVNPGLGTIQLYRSNINQLEQVYATNFLAHLDYISKVPVPGKMEWSLLRTGSQTVIPTYGDVMDTWLPLIDRNTPKPKLERGQEPPLSLTQRAFNSEEEFWANPPQFDGTVYGAAMNSSFVLVIPSLYCLMFYSVENDIIDLVGWRNYRTDMYVPQVFQSKPLPQEILKALPPDVQSERKEAMQEQMAKLGEAAGTTIPLQPSDPWIGASETNGQVFVLIDVANKKALNYQYTSKGKTRILQLQAVRNLEIDLMIPTTFNSTPDVAGLIARYNKHLIKAKMAPVMREEIEALASQSQVTSDKNSDFHAIIDQSGVVQLDFHKERQILTYRLSAQGMDLIAARDYTIEAGIGIHRRQLELMAKANRLVDTVEALAKKKEWPAVIRIAGIALDWNPWLFETFGKNRSISRIEKQKDSPELAQEWLALLQKASEEAKRREDEAKARREAALEAQKARKERK